MDTQSTLIIQFSGCNEAEKYVQWERIMIALEWRWKAPLRRQPSSKDLGNKRNNTAKS